MILPLFKPVGASTHQLAEAAGRLFGEKTTHTGTLDPLASGVVVIASGADRFNKSRLSDVKKTYRCQVLLGFSTDSHDILGLINLEKTISDKSAEKWTEVTKKFAGAQTQIIPSFSAKRWNGKSFFDAARTGKSVPNIQQNIIVHSITIADMKREDTNLLSHQITTTLNCVRGDFRQKEIISQWKNILQDGSERIVADLEITCSKRTYIRGLVRDISQQSGVPSCILSLTRTANGPYGIADCICLL